MRRRILLRGTISLIALLIAIGAGRASVLANGYETGTTMVDVRIAGTSLVIDLLVEPATLLARLDRIAGRARSPRGTPDEYLSRIAERKAELLRHVLVQFDDRLGDTHVDAVLAAPGAPARTFARPKSRADDAQVSPRLLIRLTAVIPDGARTFSWSYGLAFASYPLSVRQGASVTTVMVEGAEPSTPVPLTNAGWEHRVATRTWHVVLFACLVALVGWRARPSYSRASASTSRISSTSRRSRS